MVEDELLGDAGGAAPVGGELPYLGLAREGAVPVEQGSWIVWQGIDISGQVTLNIINTATLPK